MPSSPLSDLSATSANAMLTARASKAIGSLIGGREIDNRQQAIIRRAADLLERVVEGSLLIEDKQISGLAPSHRGLLEYDHALSALRALNLAAQLHGFTNVFVGYRDQLLSLAGGTVLSAGDLDKLKQFVSALSDLFYADLTRPVSDNRPDVLQS